MFRAVCFWAVRNWDFKYRSFVGFSSDRFRGTWSTAKAVCQACLPLNLAFRSAWWFTLFLTGPTAILLVQWDVNTLERQLILTCLHSRTVSMMALPPALLRVLLEVWIPKQSKKNKQTCFYSCFFFLLASFLHKFPKLQQDCGARGLRCCLGNGLGAAAAPGCNCISQSCWSSNWLTTVHLVLNKLTRLESRLGWFGPMKQTFWVLIWLFCSFACQNQIPGISCLFPVKYVFSLW